MRLERIPVLAVCSLALAGLLQASSADAALLFQDRHVGSNGEETIYRFEANTAATTEPIDQAKAIKVATAWADQYYSISNLTVVNAQERSMPIHFWLIAFSAPGQSKSGIYYSIVLPNGSFVEPQISRQSLTASHGPVDVAKASDLIEPPPKGVEIHGEMIFTYSWGKGLRCYGPYAPDPLWDVPSAVARPAP
ncbi:MAG: hypothetical protein WBZ19_23845 [Chthoniobacterales bacterium]